MPAWRLLRAEYPEDPPLNYALDRATAERVGQGAAPPTLRLWQPGRCLAVGRFDHRLPGFERAVQQEKAQGIAILRRISGGKAVWQDRGYLNFSVIAPRERLGVPEAYRRFSEGVILGLGTLGVETEFKHVEGAFCDGPYDLAVGDRKLVGTAQVQKRGFVTVHGTILADPDVDELVRKISEFYRRAGAPAHLKPEAMVTLREALGRDLPLEELTDALGGGFRRALGRVEPGELERDELARARELAGEARL